MKFGTIPGFSGGYVRRRLPSALLAALAVFIPAAQATFPAPVNGFIVFTNCDDGDQQVYRIMSDGSGRKRLTTGATADLVAVSPEGSRVAVGNVEDQSIFVIPIDGGVSEQNSDQFLVSGTEGVNKTDPAWTPDGNSLVFGCDLNGAPPGAEGLCVIPATGGSPSLISPGPASGDVPDVSPDGQTVAFVDLVLGQDNVYSVPIGGGPVTQLTDCGAVGKQCDHPNFSPDSDTVLALEMHDNGVTGSCIAVIDISGSLPVQPVCLANSSPGVDDDEAPVFSPDGQAIAIDAGDGHLAILGANGTGRTKFHTGLAHSCSPSWGSFVDKKAPEAFCGQFFFDAQRRAEAKQGQLSVKFINRGCDAAALTALQPDLVKFDAAVDEIALKANESIVKKGGALECDPDLQAEFADGVDPTLIERIDLLDGAATGADFLTSEVMDFCDS